MSPTSNARNVPLPTTLPRRSPLVQFVPERASLLPPPSSPLFMDPSDSIATLERRPLDAGAAAQLLAGEGAPRSATVKAASERAAAPKVRADATEEVTLDDVLEISAAPSTSPLPASLPATATLELPALAASVRVSTVSPVSLTPSFAPHALAPTTDPTTGMESVLPPLRPAPRTRGGWAAAAVLASAFATGLAAWLVLVPSRDAAPLKIEARSPSATSLSSDDPVERFAPARVSEPMPTARTPVAVEDLPKRGVDASHGLLVFPKELRAHRVYVDGALAGHAGDPVRVRCGRRSVRVGTTGRAKVLDVPCGAELAVTR